jgi:hypothetical protein
MTIRESHSCFAVYAFSSPKNISGIFDFCSAQFGYRR